MTDVYYNSWESSCKTPFGAIAAGEPVTFRIRCALKNINRVFLIIYKEGTPPQTLEMLKETVDSYSVHYRPQKGLYFYYFQFDQETESGVKLYYYGRAGNSGTGELVDNHNFLAHYQLTCYEGADKAPDWYREGIAYQIFPDRFFNGNPDNRVNHPKKNTFIYATQCDEPMYIKNAAGEIVRWDFFGGNLLGIKKKIGYLKELGVSIIYLNPIFKASSNHRYDTDDYFEIDPMLGTREEFVSLVEALHQAGIRVILDGVFSHAGWNSRYFNRNKQYGETEGAYNNPESPYYDWFIFQEYPDKYTSWWNIQDLPEFNKHDPHFQQFIYGEADSVLSEWTPLVDGWRLDVADELPDFFIEQIRNRLAAYPDKVLIGEVWEDASNKISYNQRRQYILGGHLNGVMNYPLRRGIINLLLCKETPETVASHLMTLQENYPKEVFYNSFNNLGTHDTERILTMLNLDREKLDLALGFMFMMPGVPCIYYGDEAGLTGGKDPENRKFFPWGRESKSIYALFKKWVTVRQTQPAIQTGDLSLCYCKDMLGLIRYTDDEFVCYIMNPTDTVHTINCHHLTFLREVPFNQKQLANLLEGQIVFAKDYYLVSGKLDGKSYS